MAMYSRETKTRTASMNCTIPEVIWNDADGSVGGFYIKLQVWCRDGKNRCIVVYGAEADLLLERLSNAVVKAKKKEGV